MGAGACQSYHTDPLARIGVGAVGHGKNLYLRDLTAADRAFPFRKVIFPFHQ